MVKNSREFRRVHKSIWIALALLLVFSFLIQNVAGSVARIPLPTLEKHGIHA